jgi:hypothetical protein
MKLIAGEFAEGDTVLVDAQAGQSGLVLTKVVPVAV